MERTTNKRFYSEWQTYTGWWAKYANAKGIAHTDGVMLFGTWNSDPTFPNEGKSWASPSNSEWTKTEIDTLEYRNDAESWD